MRIATLLWPVVGALCCAPTSSKPDQPAEPAPRLPAQRQPAPLTPVPLPGFAADTLSLPPAPKEGPVSVVSWSQTGSHLAVCCSNSDADSKVLVWNMHTGKVVARLARPGSFPTPPRLVWSPDGRYLAASRRSTLVVWRTTDWSTVYRTKLENMWGGFSFSPLGDHVAMSGPRGVFKVVELPTGLAMASAEIHPSLATYDIELAWSPTGDFAVWADYTPPQFWTMRGGPAFIAHDSGKPNRLAVAWAGNGRRVAVNAGQGRLTVWDVLSGVGKRLRSEEDDLDVGGPLALPVAWAGSTVLAFGPGGELTTWDTERADTPHVVLPEAPQWWLGLAVSDDGRVAAAANEDGLHMVAVASGRQKRVLESADLKVDRLASLNERRFVARGEIDGRWKLVVWSPRADQQWAVEVAQSDTFDVSRDGQVLALARGDVVLARPSRDDVTKLTEATPSEVVRRFGPAVTLPPPSPAATPRSEAVVIGNVRYSTAATAVDTAFHDTQQPVADLSALRRLPKLRILRVDQESLAALSTLPALPTLRHLWLGESHTTNTPADLSKLAGLPDLMTLRLRALSAPTLKPLGAHGDSLVELVCDGCNIQDISALSRMISLRRLVWTPHVGVSTLKPFLKMRKLESLVLTTNGSLPSALPLAQLPALRRVIFGGVVPDDVDALRQARPDIRID